MMKNAFYCSTYALFVLKVFKFLYQKGLIKKDGVNFKFYYVTARLTNDFKTFIAQYLEN